LRKRGWWGVGLLGVALAGSITLLVPGKALPQVTDPQGTQTILHEQPDRAVQREANLLSNRIEGALRRGASLLSTLGEGDLTAFSRERMFLHAQDGQWAISLFGQPALKSSDQLVQPPGEAYLNTAELSDIQHSGPWVAERPSRRCVIVAAPGRNGQVLATQVPYRYFDEAIAHLPAPTGVRRFLLNAAGEPLDATVKLSDDEKEYCRQLLQEGDGFLATPDSLYAVSRVPLTGWAMVVRHPAGVTVPPLNLDTAQLSGPTMVSTGPLDAGPNPKGLILFPIAGAALFLGWRMKKRHDQPRLPRSTREARGMAPDHASLPSEPAPQLPAVIGGGDVEFLRTEQVRNLRELWNHTEERLSSQRNWVREELRRVTEQSTSSMTELAAVVNLSEQRLEDARSAWNEVQSQLLIRVEEARQSMTSERMERSEGDGHLLVQLQELGERTQGEFARIEGSLAEVRGLLSEAEGRTGEAIAALHSVIEGDREDRAETSESLTVLAERLRPLEALEGRLTEALVLVDGRLGSLADELRTEAERARSQSTALEARSEQAEMALEAQGERAGSLLSALDTLEQRVGSVLTEVETRIDAVRAELRDQSEGRFGEWLATCEERLASSAAQLREELRKMRESSTASALELGTLVSKAEERLEGARQTLDALTDRTRPLEGLEGRVTEALASVDERLSALTEDLRQAVEQGQIRLTASEARHEQTGMALEVQGDRVSALVRSVDALERRVSTALDEVAQRLNGVSDELRQQNESRFGTWIAAFEERLASSAAQLREELRKVRESSTASAIELGAIVSMAEERLDEARKGWEDLQAALSERVDVAKDTADGVAQRLEAEFGRIEASIASVRDLMAAQSTRVEGMAQVAASVETLEQRVSMALQEVDERLNEVRTELRAEFERSDRLEAAQGEVNARLEEWRDSWRSEAEQQLTTFAGDLQAEVLRLATSLDRQIEDVSQVASHLDSLVERYDHRIEHLDSGLTELGAELRTEAEHALGELDARLSDQMQALAALRSDLVSTEEAWHERLQSSAEKWAAESREQLRGLGDRLDEHVTESAARTESWQEAAEQKLAAAQQEVQARMDEQRGEIGKLRDALAKGLADLQGRVTQQGEQIEEFWTLEDQVSGLIARLESRIAAAEAKQLAAIADSEAQAATLRAETETQVEGLREQVQELGDRLDSQLESHSQTLDQRLSQADAASLDRTNTVQRQLDELSGQVGSLLHHLEEAAEQIQQLTGMKAQLEELAVGEVLHAAETESVKEAIAQLRDELADRTSQAASELRLAELTEAIQHVAAQGLQLASAVETNTAAGLTLETWIAEQLGVIQERHEQAIAEFGQKLTERDQENANLKAGMASLAKGQEIVARLEQQLAQRDRENAALRQGLATLQQGQEALANRVHMVVQVLAKISK